MSPTNIEFQIASIEPGHWDGPSGVAEDEGAVGGGEEDLSKLPNQAPRRHRPLSRRSQEEGSRTLGTNHSARNREVRFGRTSEASGLRRKSFQQYQNSL